MVAQGGDETPDASADYAGFEPVAPDSSRRCRVVRGRRCRPERIVRKRAIHKPFSGETQPIEIIHGDRTNLSTSDDTTSTAGAVDVFFSVGSIATSSKRLYGYLKREVGGRFPFLCLYGFPRRGLGLGSIRGGATPNEEGADTGAEEEIRSTCSFNPLAHVRIRFHIENHFVSFNLRVFKVVARINGECGDSL